MIANTIFDHQFVTVYLGLLGCGTGEMVFETKLALLNLEIKEMDNVIPPPTPQLEQISEGEWILPGSTLVNEVSDILDIVFQPRGRYKTIAGFVMTELGYIPDEGDQLNMFGCTFTVLTRNRLRLVKIRIQKNPDVVVND